MPILLLRTVIIYIILLVIMRIMGKRQLGELELSELVTTILLSEIATTPITNKDSDMWHAILPIITIAILEIILSFLFLKLPILKKLLTNRPAVIINKGVISKKEMLHSRITLDELIAQIRQNNVYDLNDVDYAILEENGKMTVIPKSMNRPPDAESLNIKVKDSGVMHIIISDGKIEEKNLSYIKKDISWINKILAPHHIKPSEIFIMTINDALDIFIETYKGKVISIKN